MITLTDIRKDARDHLKNKWGKGALITLCYFIIECIISFIMNIVEENDALYVIFEIVQIIISVPLSYGIVVSFIKLKRDEEVNAFDFLKIGFGDFAKAWKITLNTILKLILPAIIVIVCLAIFLAGSIYLYKFPENTTGKGLAVIGFILFFISDIYFYIKSLNYVVSINVAYDKPELSAKEAVEESKTLMKGNRGTYFTLGLSFIGWAILAVFTLGIGYFWLIPYIQVAQICFYEKIKNGNYVEVEEIEE